MPGNNVQRAVSTWTEDGSLRVEIEQDVEQPRAVRLAIGGRSRVSHVGDANGVSYFEVDGLDAIDDVLQLLADARAHAAAEWPHA